MVSSAPFHLRIARTARLIKVLKAKFDKTQTFPERLAGVMTGAFGNISFLIVHIAWFVIWMVVNLGLIPGIPVFDPFPFGLLTLIVSLEAIILGIFILISQNREEKINDLREEIDLKVNLIAESEITKIMELLVKLSEKNNVDLSNDDDLAQMLKPLHEEKIEASLEEEVSA